ncbi:MAG: SH3 domain-containing protein, partial [Lachnospiraceae bacterium]|nr:SH3 domain-containing protein [Lachnospiraceae bacterium]
MVLMGMVSVKSTVLAATEEPTVSVIEDGAIASLNAGTPLAFSLSILEEGELPVEGAVEIVLPKEETGLEGLGIDWDKKCLTKEKGSINVRAEASTDSAVVGKLFEGGAADILEKGEKWTKIVSGSVEGFISNDLLVYGKEAEELAKEKGTYVATVNENSIRVRSEAGGDGKILGLVGKGEKLEAVSSEQVNGYVPVKFGDKEGYISEEYVSIEFELGVAKTLKEVQAEENAKKAAAAKEKAKKEGKTVNAAVSASADDVTLLAALLMCEAGNQSYECKLGVASVVMNRVRSGRYPNDVYSVIYQAGQFPPASVTGKVGAYLASGYINSGCMQAAQEAISGISNVGSAIGFAHAGSRDGIVIGPIVFF